MELDLFEYEEAIVSSLSRGVIMANKKAGGGKKSDHLVSIGTLSFHVCEDGVCGSKIIFAMKGSIPILWVGADDFEEACERMIDSISDDFAAMKKIATDISTLLWVGRGFGDMWRDAISKIGAARELSYIRGLPLEELPLLPVDSIVTGAGAGAGREAYKNRFTDGV